MYTTQNNRQKERESLQHRTIIDRECRDSKIERKGRQLQIVVYNTEQQIDREIIRQRGRGGRYTTQNNRQRNRVYSIEQQIENAEIVRQRGRGGRYRQMYTTQSNRQIENNQIERKGREVHNIEQQIDRERVYSIDHQIENAKIVRQRGRGGRYRSMYTTQNNRQIERQ